MVDTFRGEIATAYAVRDRGLVVITSCGHAGVINSVRQLQRLTRVERIHAVAGGFHLAPAPDEVVAKTVAALRKIDPDSIVPMHCTGLNTLIALHREMPVLKTRGFGGDKGGLPRGSGAGPRTDDCEDPRKLTTGSAFCPSSPATSGIVSSLRPRKVAPDFRRQPPRQSRARARRVDARPSFRWAGPPAPGAHAGSAR